MPLSLLLILSVPTLAAVGAVLRLRAALRRILLRRAAVERVLVLAAPLCAGSYLIRSSGASGTGTRTAHGFPKFFFFFWRSWEHPVSREGLNGLYLAGNYVAWVALVSAAALAWALLRRRRRAAAAER